MFISAKRILDLNSRYNILEKISFMGLYPEGVGVDVRVGEVFRILPEEFAFLGAEKDLFYLQSNKKILDDLSSGKIPSELLKKFELKKISISSSSIVSTLEDKLWEVSSGSSKFRILNKQGMLYVYEVSRRRTPQVEKIADIHEDPFKQVFLRPGEELLIKTIERVNIPNEKIEIFEGEEASYIMAIVFPRSTLQRSGVDLTATKVDPGYFGELTFKLKNAGKVLFVFEVGARIATLVFARIEGEIEKGYRGQWLEGRVSTFGFEDQK